MSAFLLFHIKKKKERKKRKRIKTTAAVIEGTCPGPVNERLESRKPYSHCGNIGPDAVLPNRRGRVWATLRTSICSDKLGSKEVFFLKILNLNFCHTKEF